MMITIFSSPVLLGILAWFAILVIGAIASKVAEVMGKWKFAKRIDAATRLFGIGSIIVLVLVSIGIGVHAVATM